MYAPPPTSIAPPRFIASTAQCIAVHSPPHMICGVCVTARILTRKIPGSQTIHKNPAALLHLRLQILPRIREVPSWHPQHQYPSFTLCSFKRSRNSDSVSFATFAPGLRLTFPCRYNCRAFIFLPSSIRLRTVYDMVSPNTPAMKSRSCFGSYLTDIVMDILLPP